MSGPERKWYPLSPKVAASRRAATATPVDPLTGFKFAIAGRVVTMDSSFAVLNNAVLYVDRGVIVAVQDRHLDAPEGFDSVQIIETQGTVFPGLIELHNHLSYNALPLWSPVPRKFTNRDQWASLQDYRKLISGPMTVIGKTPRLLPHLVRYVEAKCLLGGVTTSQGIRLASNAGVGRFYRGLVRNVEQTDDPELPEADARIADVIAKDAESFFKRVEEAEDHNCMLLHLSEGTDASARKHFLSLEVEPGRWALSNALAGIHAAALTRADFDILASHGASMVWSPLSNILLYGDTARIDDAKRAGVLIGLGSDWSPSGSKNLLGEMKVAAVVSESKGGIFSYRDIVAMATINGAAILKWSKKLGSLEVGKYADFLVIQGTEGDPYGELIRAKETSILMVAVNGTPRYGVPDLMKRLVPEDQTIRVGGSTRRLYLKQETADPDVTQVSLRTAKSELSKAFRDIRKLARDLEKPQPAIASSKRLSIDRPEPVVWSLALDEVQNTGVELRPRLPYNGPKDFTGPHVRSAALAAAAPKLSEILAPIALDPLTVADDHDFVKSISDQPNLPQEIKNGLLELL